MYKLSIFANVSFLALVGLSAVGAVSDSAFAGGGGGYMPPIQAPATLGHGQAVIDTSQVDVYNISRRSRPLAEGDDFGIVLPVTYSAADSGLGAVTMKVTLREAFGQSAQVMSFRTPFLREGNRRVFDFRPFNTEHPSGTYVEASRAINFDIVLTYTNSDGPQEDKSTFSFPVIHLHPRLFMTKADIEQASDLAIVQERSPWKED
jgi:hypothetical protein